MLQPGRSEGLQYSGAVDGGIVTGVPGLCEATCCCCCCCCCCGGGGGGGFLVVVGFFLTLREGSASF